MATVCTNCGFNNPPGMRFCGNCGTRMPVTAPRSLGDSLDSRRPSDSAEITPENLGVLTGTDLINRLQQAGLDAAGQRRNVTVLFVDLSQYTVLSEALQDDELYELMQRFIRLLVTDVYKYEGVVDKLTGDGLMALFGAPIAHENNTERALRSALDMVNDVDRLKGEISESVDLRGYDLRIHIGLNSGSVIVGGVGGDGLMNYTATGDVVNVARRLEESAGPGEIVVGESVAHKTSRIFDFHGPQTLFLKNVSKPVNAYRLIGPKQNPGPLRGIEGLRATMIGRDSELRLARGMVDRLIEKNQGGVVLLVGEGGMGKSRLTSELKNGLDLSKIKLLEGQSLTYRKSIAYWIFQDVLRNYLGVTVETSELELRSRLSHRLLVLFGEAGREKLTYLESLLSLPPSDHFAASKIRFLTAGQLRQQIFLAVRDLLVAVARQKPLILILEDLHWADDASLDLTRFLLESSRNSPLIILAISRPFEGSAIQAIRDWASQRLSERYLIIQLEALPPDESAELLQALLPIQDLPIAFREQIIHRSAGLPFYLEEILRMLIEENIIFLDHDAVGETGKWRLSPGVDFNTIGVPETLQGLILTRFDRLSPVQKRLIQTASVVGYRFNVRVLQEVITNQTVNYLPIEIESSLSYLTAHEFIVPIPADQEAGEVGYDFRHVLVSDAVYKTLLQRDRRELHTLTGKAIEKLYSDRLEGQIEVLAGHFLRSPLLDRALHYLTLAGQKEANSYANEQAKQFFLQAFDVLGKVKHTADQLVEVVVGLGDALLTCGDYTSSRDYYQYGLSSLRIDGDVVRGNQHHASVLLRKIAQTLESQGNYDDALTCLSKAQTLIDGEKLFLADRASILSDTGWIHFRRGALDQAEDELDEALLIAEGIDRPDVLASVLNRLAGIYFQRVDPGQAAGYLKRSLAIREAIGDVVGVARLFNNLGLLNWKQGNLSDALNNFNQAFVMQAKLGDVEGIISLHTNIGLLNLDLGEFVEAENHFREALNLAAQIGHNFHVNEAHMHLGLLNTYTGNWHKVIEACNLAISGFNEMGIRENMLDLYVSLGWAFMELGSMTRLSETIQKISEFRELHFGNENQMDNGGLVTEGEGRVERFSGHVEWKAGRLPDALNHFRRSIEIFSQVGNKLEQARVQSDLARFFGECGDAESSQTQASEARMIFEKMGARMELDRLNKFEHE